MQFRAYKISKFTLLLVAIQILNLCLFAHPIVESNSDVNVINSLTEYVAEVVLEMENSFPENKAHQTHHHHKHSTHHHILKFQPIAKIDNVEHFTPTKKDFCKKSYAFFQTNSFPKVIEEISSPPPKA